MPYIDGNEILLTRTYYATFSPEHRHPFTGEPMEGFYITIKAEDEEAARFAIFELFHDDWRELFESHQFDKSTCPKGEYASCDAKPFNIPRQ
jgi:hypothetical protein